MNEIENLMDSFLDNSTPQYKQMQWQKAFLQQELFTLKAKKSFPYEDTINAQTIIDRNLSKNFIAALPKATRLELEEKIKRILISSTQIEDLNHINAPYHTDVLCYISTKK